jgi:NitT/TauT family transport system ATP-binding protein
VFLATRVVVMSGRPGRVVTVVDVPFPHPRPARLRYTPEFAAVAARVSEALRASTPVRRASEPAA